MSTPDLHVVARPRDATRSQEGIATLQNSRTEEEVDDTIHYLYRFREECKQGASYPQALKRCHSSVGQAMLYTSAIVVLGFAIFAESNFTPTIYFGLLTAVGMPLALLAALSLLPRLVGSACATV
jgi:predicted RND superfamily exporter protein